MTRLSSMLCLAADTRPSSVPSRRLSYTKARAVQERGGRRSTPPEPMSAVYIAARSHLLPIPETIAQSVSKRFAELEALSDGWAGAGSVRPLQLNSARAWVTLCLSMFDGAYESAPWVACSPDGSVGVDWRNLKRQLAVTFEAGGRVEYYAHEPEGAERCGAFEVAAFHELLLLGGWLAGSAILPDE